MLNAAAALVIGKIARNLREGVSKAQQSIDSRSAVRKLEELVDFTQRVGNA